MMDFHFAELYEVETKVLKQAAAMLWSTKTFSIDDTDSNVLPVTVRLVERLCGYDPPGTI